MRFLPLGVSKGTTTHRRGVPAGAGVNTYRKTKGEVNRRRGEERRRREGADDQSGVGQGQLKLFRLDVTDASAESLSVRQARDHYRSTQYLRLWFHLTEKEPFKHRTVQPGTAPRRGTRLSSI